MADETAAEAAALIATLMGEVMEDASALALDTRALGRAGLRHADRLHRIAADILAPSAALIVAVRYARATRRRS